VLVPYAEKNKELKCIANNSYIRLSFVLASQLFFKLLLAKGKLFTAQSPCVTPGGIPALMSFASTGYPPTAKQGADRQLCKDGLPSVKLTALDVYNALRYKYNQSIVSKINIRAGLSSALPLFISSDDGRLFLMKLSAMVCSVPNSRMSRDVPSA